MDVSPATVIGVLTIIVQVVGFTALFFAARRLRRASEDLAEATQTLNQTVAAETVNIVNAVDRNAITGA